MQPMDLLKLCLNEEHTAMSFCRDGNFLTTKKYRRSKRYPHRGKLNHIQSYMDKASPRDSANQTWRSSKFY